MINSIQRQMFQKFPSQYNCFKKSATYDTNLFVFNYYVANDSINDIIHGALVVDNPFINGVYPW